MAMLDAFQWGSNGKKLSPGEVSQYRQVAAALAARNGVPKDIGEGLSAIGDALGYRSTMDQANTAETEGRAQVAQALAAAQQAGTPEAYMGVVGNEWASPEQRAVAQALAQRSWSLDDRNAQWGREDAQRSQDRGFALEDRQAGWAHEDKVNDWKAGLPTVINDQLVDPQSREVLGDYRTPVAPKAPPTQTIYDPTTGRQQVVEWDGKGWNPIGGVEAPKAPLVTVNTGDAQDGALNKALSESEGKSWNGFKDAAAVSAANQQDFQVLAELATMAPQGPVQGRLAEAFQGFSAAGDAFQSIVKRIAPTLRAPGSGSTSDIEYDGMLRSLPALKNSPEANAMILSIMQAKADLNIKRGDIITAYQNGEMSVVDARKQLGELNRTSIITPEMRKALDGLQGESRAPADGETATNPQTGEKIVLRDGQWVPAQ